MARREPSIRSGATDESDAEEQALSVAYRPMYRAVKVVRLDNDAAGTTMSLAEIRAGMQQSAQDAR